MLEKGEKQFEPKKETEKTEEFRERERERELNEKELKSLEDLLLTPEQELNDFEKEVVEAQKKAIKAVEEFKKSKKERYYGIPFADINKFKKNGKETYYGISFDNKKRIELSEEEDKAWWKSKFALGKAIEYLTNKGKIPLDIKGYNDLYDFVKNFYHPQFAEDWGYRFERSYKLDFKFSITPEVEKIMIQGDIEFKQNIFKEVYKRKLEDQGYSPKKVKEIMKEIKDRDIFSIEFRDDKVSPESMEKILKKWAEKQKRKNEIVKRIKERFNIEEDK